MTSLLFVTVLVLEIHFSFSYPSPYTHPVTEHISVQTGTSDGGLAYILYFNATLTQERHDLSLKLQKDL